ncbi:MAG: DUF1998 domain-containing protein [Flavobacteriaceae bacterium]|nr:DUF1998 domain-containing protein [Flavobacteriaceae bacterium]
MPTISNERQYNVSKSKHKLLSSVSGPGAIATTLFGTHVLISDVTKWGFVKKSFYKIREITDQKDISNALEKIGVQNIEDYRFIEFLKEQYDYVNLKCLISIPDMPLNDRFSPNWKDNPINKLLKKNSERYIPASDYMVSATHFPKWFKNHRGDLKELSVWFELWEEECKKVVPLKHKHFAPPRDAKNKNSYKITDYDEDGNQIKIDAYKKLSQTYLVIACPEGHLNDIPWSKYLNFKNGNYEHNDDASIDLYDLEDCCKNPDLQWIENKTQSETIGNIIIKCKSCDKKTNLEGLGERAFKCTGNKPWEVQLDNKNFSVFKKGRFCSKFMRVVPVSARYLYFADIFSSIYIPVDADTSLRENDLKYEDELKKLRAIEQLKGESIFCEESIKIQEAKILRELEKIKNNIENKKERNIGEREYRFAEYKYFSKKEYADEGLKLKSIHIGLEHFKRITIIEKLKLTTVQLGFRRINPENSKSQNIFSSKLEQIQVLPAIESVGEGLFLELSKNKIDSWQKKHKKELNNRIKDFLVKPSEDASYRELKQEICDNPSAFYLIHSFAHLLMKEFEFSCGYPAASLRERLYISKKHDMYGVLIYTTDGSEGSMGGLISQGEPSNLKNLIKRALIRSEHCSSDPLCWEETGQSIEKFNLSACFSCMLVSETSCEKMNLGLDRRILVDPEFGFFKHLLDN